MNLIFLIIISIVLFVSILLGGKKYRSTALYALAIGGVVNANFFHAESYPIDCFGLSFGLDSIIHTLFIFCVAVMFFQEGKKSAYILSISSVIAIELSAVMQLLSDLLSNSHMDTTWRTFSTFTMSAIISLIAVTMMLEVLERLNGKLSKYWLLIFGIIMASTVYTALFYPISMLINYTPNKIWTLVLTSIIGKVIAILSSILSFYLTNLYDNKCQNKAKKLSKQNSKSDTK